MQTAVKSLILIRNCISFKTYVEKINRTILWEHIARNSAYTSWIYGSTNSVTWIRILNFGTETIEAAETRFL